MKLVFLLDVDNTLIDNDRLKSDLADRIEQMIGQEKSRRFWEIYEQVRDETEVVNFPETIGRFIARYGDEALRQNLTHLIDVIPFKSYLYPHVLETIAYLKTLGETVILSDGDTVFQPHKIRESGLERAVDGKVLVFVHKEDELPQVFAAYPADHYVAVDDKPRIVSALEELCPSEFTTVLVLQGKYARSETPEPRPDYAVEHVADLRHFSEEQFVAPGRMHTPSR